MPQHNFRTYHRRNVTRESGYHTCDETTGGECLIKQAERYTCLNTIEIFSFHRQQLDLVELFEKGISIIAFGGYIYTKNKAEITLEIDYCYEHQRYNFKGITRTIDKNNWINIGIHSEQILYSDLTIQDVNVKMTIKSRKNNKLDFICFDFDVVSKNEYLDSSCAVSFYQKTDMHVPYLYYLRTNLSMTKYLVNKNEYVFEKGKLVILKSCNRCGRYLPINIEDEKKTLSFSLHCKKQPPCRHPLFSTYKIMNDDEFAQIGNISDIRIEQNRVISYHGHQLECKACKKFFVNAALNPQRNPQQFKEDGLRRRAIEILVNTLLNRNFVHFEFEKMSNKEFSNYIWEKFDKRCFKCGPNSKPIDLKEMALDHTMPLAYLYRLDETATCLCKDHNSQKSDNFPVDYYSEDELIRLSSITGLSLEKLHTRAVNKDVLDLLVKNIVWFYDEFLMDKDYQKIRDNIKTADKINDSLKRVIAGEVDLAEEYKKITGNYPKSVTIK